MLLPVQFNDGRDVPAEWLADAVLEVVERFGAVSYETQRIEGHWRQAGVHYRDTLVRLVIDVPDTPANRKWMKTFKQQWKTRLEQLAHHYSGNLRPLRQSRAMRRLMASPLISAKRPRRDGCGRTGTDCTPHPIR